MENIKVISDGYDTCVCNVDTGEVVYKTTIPSKKVPNMEKYIGVEVKHPYECTRKDQLEDTLSQLDGYFTKPSKVNYQFLLDSMVDSDMGRVEMAVLKAVSENICGWNIYFGTTREIAESAKIDTSNVSRAVRNSKHLRVIQVGKAPKGEWILEINPLLSWKGDMEYREGRLVSWYLRANS